MRQRKSENQWFELVKAYKTSGLNLSTWCREHGISKSSIYPYLKRFSSQLECKEQEWSTVTIPKNVEASTISLKVGNISIDIQKGFDKETLTEILNVVTSLC